MKKTSYWILFLVVTLLCCGCSSKKEQDNQEISVYYLNSSDRMLSTSQYEVESTGTEAMVKEVLEALQTPDNFKKFHTVFPNDVKVESYEVKGNLVRVYFNMQYANLKPSEEVLLRAAVVQTLVQVQGIEFVSFYVGNEALKDKAGNTVGLMSASDFLQSEDLLVEEYQEKNLILYFASEDGTALVAEQREGVRYNANTSIEKLVVEQLKKGPKTAGAKETIPGKATLLSVTTKDGICYVNFDSGFLAEGYMQKPEITIYSMVNSIIQNCNVNQVQILIDGSSEVVFRNTMDLNVPFSMNKDWIKEQDK